MRKLLNYLSLAGVSSSIVQNSMRLCSCCNDSFALASWHADGRLFRSTGRMRDLLYLMARLPASLQQCDQHSPHVLHHHHPLKGPPGHLCSGVRDVSRLRRTLLFASHVRSGVLVLCPWKTWPSAIVPFRLSCVLNDYFTSRASTLPEWLRPISHACVCVPHGVIV